jgi:hypothetical protein
MAVRSTADLERSAAWARRGDLKVAATGNAPAECDGETDPLQNRAAA